MGHRQLSEKDVEKWQRVPIISPEETETLASSIGRCVNTEAMLP